MFLNICYYQKKKRKKTEGRIDDLKEFVRTVMSAGKTTRRSYLETRIRLYQQRKEKSSITHPYFLL